jgi:DNA-binding MurR/RpiR family transcriptional regulator
MLMHKIREQLNFTPIDKSIGNYILENPDAVLSCNAHELALLTYTSPSAIVRFCKKLNTKGYPDFRYQYIEEHYENKLVSTLELSSNLNLTENLMILANRYETIAKNSADRLNKSTLAQVIHLLRSSEYVDFYASGLNYGIARTACERLSVLGYHAQVQVGINKHYIAMMTPQKREKTCTILISHTGTNEAVLEAARYLHSQNMKMVFLGRPNNELHKIAKYHLYWENDHLDSTFDNLSYPVSLLFILDLLYVLLAFNKDVKFLDNF